MSARTWDVVLLGDLFIDHIFSGLPRWPGLGEEVYARDYARDLGGGAANTACALGRLGRRVALAGMVGATEAAWIADRLAAFGVAADGLCETADPTGITVGLSLAEDRSFFSHPGANRGLAEWIATERCRALMADARHVHVAMPIARSAAAELIAFLHGHGCRVTLDVGHHPDWLSDPDSIATIAEADLFLPNAAEAACLSRRNDPAAYLDLAARNGIASACVKLGADGAVMTAGGTCLRVAPPPVSVVDTTGAGDAFDAGLIDAMLDDAGPQELIRRGCAIGALSTRAAGALAALPTRQELEELVG